MTYLKILRKILKLSYVDFWRNDCWSFFGRPYSLAFSRCWTLPLMVGRFSIEYRQVKVDFGPFLSVLVIFHDFSILWVFCSSVVRLLLLVKLRWCRFEPALMWCALVWVFCPRTLHRSRSQRKARDSLLDFKGTTFTNRTHIYDIRGKCTSQLTAHWNCAHLDFAARLMTGALRLTLLLQKVKTRSRPESNVGSLMLT